VSTSAAAPRLLVAVGEASGDSLAAAIVAELSRRGPIDARGVVGPLGRRAGIEAVADLDGLHAVGLVDGARAARSALRRVRALEQAARAWSPHALLTVDAPSFTLRAAAAVRAQGVPVVHVGAPQVWAWRPWRRRRLGRVVDELLCLLPFEPPWFAGHVAARYVGHPATAARPQPRAKRRTVALLPGSRPSEVRRLWPTMRAVARRVVQDRPARLVAVAAPGVQLTGLDAEVVHSVHAAADAWVALAASGTVTLELAALAVPQVEVYRTDPLTHALGRRLVRIDHVALPNLVAGKTVVPERVQHLDPDELALRVVQAADGARPAPLDLQGEGAVGRMADAVQAWLRA